MAWWRLLLGLLLLCSLRLVDIPLQWRHNGRNTVSNNQPHDCLLNRLFRHRSKKTSKLHVTGLCAGNSPVTGEFPAQMASNAENASMWWRHQLVIYFQLPSLYMQPYRHEKTNPSVAMKTKGPRYLSNLIFALATRHVVQWSRVISTNT